MHNRSNFRHYLAADTASLLRYSGFSSAVLACASVRQQWPHVAALLVPQTEALPGNRDSHSPCTERSKRSLTSLLRPYIFTVSFLVSVLAYQLLIQLSFQSKCHFRLIPERCFINLPLVNNGLRRYSNQTAQSGQTDFYGQEGQTKKLYSLSAAAKKHITYLEKLSSQ